MENIKNKVKDAIGNREDKKATPGNSVERGANNAANSRVDNFANQAGIPQSADNSINKAVDGKINTEIPGGN